MNNNWGNGQNNNWGNGHNNNYVNFTNSELSSFTPLQLADTFCNAIEEENENLIQKILSNDEFIKKFMNYVGGYEMTPLLFALKNSRLDIVETLLEKGANVNIPAVENLPYDEFGETPLLFATRQSSDFFSLIDELLDAGANVNYRDAAGFSALHNVAYQGHDEIVQLLLAKGAKVNVETTRDVSIPLDRENSGWTPLMGACMNNHPTVVSQLLQAGANVHLKNMSGETALMIASKFGAKDCISSLVEAGANVNEENCVRVDSYSVKKACYTPLMYACDGNHKDAVQQLLLLGANVNQQNVTNKDSLRITPLMVAANVDSPAITQMLLDAGADIYKKDIYGKMAIEYSENKQVKNILGGRERFYYGRNFPFSKLGKTIPLNVHKRIANFLAGPVNTNKTNVINMFNKVRHDRIKENAKRIGPKKFTRRFHKSKKGKQITRRRNKH